MIHNDQVGFIQGREAKDATTRAIDILYYTKAKGLETCFLFTDAKKAFDRANWSFMFQTLEDIGLGGKFSTWIKSLYSSSTDEN